VNNFFSCDSTMDPSGLYSVTYDQFFFIDNDRGISGGMTAKLELVIHRFFYQPQQIQNFQQKDYYYRTF
jgi:hypothetical protein